MLRDRETDRQMNQCSNQFLLNCNNFYKFINFVGIILHINSTIGSKILKDLPRSILFIYHKPVPGLF